MHANAGAVTALQQAVAHLGSANQNAHAGTRTQTHTHLQWPKFRCEALQAPTWKKK